MRSFRKKSRVLYIIVLSVVLCYGILSVFTLGGSSNEHGYGNSVDWASRRLLESKSNSSQLYPPEVFTETQLKHGAVVLHALGLLYMFVALALVCDEFFVPSLAVIIDKLQISEDVAGATFMAAGGSAPELFTSLIGVFIANSNVGIGTIVGSAVFNILFVIGMCALFSKTVLALTWWPLFRDVSFYSVDLILLIVFFRDALIKWHEALILFIMYLLYVLFMKYNEKIEAFVKTRLRKCSGKVDDDYDSDFIGQPRAQRAHSIPILHSGGNRFRHGMLQLMIHSIDPLHHHAKASDKAMTLQAIATLKVVIGTTTPTQPDGSLPNLNIVDSDNNKIPAIMDTSHPVTNGNGVNHSHEGSGPVTSNGNVPAVVVEGADQCDSSEDKPTLEEEEEPLDLSWPDEWKKRINYIIVAPLIFPLWLTLADVRKEEKRKFFMWTFFGSILWIAIFAYAMVWWASIIGKTAGVDEAIMGLTFLAAGTSIPDLITSVIVAKKGFGDMAVSSSVGSNIFDICVGLPIPWLLYQAIYGGDPVNVDSNGLLCSIILLFFMLLLVIITIAASKWKMSKILGVFMLVMYGIFLLLSVLLELKIIPCPDVS